MESNIYPNDFKGATSRIVFCARMGPQIARRSTENNPAGRLPSFSSWLEAITSIKRDGANRKKQEGLRKVLSHSKFGGPAAHPGAFGGK